MTASVGVPIAKRIGLALGSEYWTTDGSSDPDKVIEGNMNDAALKAVGVAENTEEFRQSKMASGLIKNPMKTIKLSERSGTVDLTAGSDSILMSLSRFHMNLYQSGLKGGPHLKENTNTPF